MSSKEKDKQKAIEDLLLALKELTKKEALSLRERAMVLEAIEKIEGQML
jgi:hypothetical protein